ncbi:FAD-dependent oxidoreductase [Croceimicrobium hydrocarbonivorans]|uniref:Kynurenine 3-monooxygenase n=1 Tax=Croceimicrobium hydrocarbonivorans TaxID=2761580 RepID=A0A7H0VHU4_9FLAO|nr:NAD(P)/FAD-dependent oxidoreductase [Croceimicrobium hydrocarbonivorans]QNR25292.1 FAD-dependent monooxygenase [Croceimicrobium hydrocarbonivorans]
MQEKNISIAGAGLVGSLLSLYLAKRGHKVEIFERRPDARKNLLDGGRSINLALSDRGLQALAKVGLEEKVLKEMAIPMYGRVMHSREGKLTYQPYGKEGQAINSVSRAGLNMLMMDEAEKRGVKIHFSQACADVDLENASAVYRNREGEERKVESDLLFGADGAFSAVRSIMQKTDRFSYSQEYIEHGYKELEIPAGPNGEFLLEKNALHIWPRGSYMLIALPNPDASFTCTLFFPMDGEVSFASLDTVDKARSFFEKEFADALDMMPNFDRDWQENPDSSLVIIRCFPWTRNAKVALIGDASHAIVPFYGQGMNAGFEDCFVLDRLMDEYGDDWEGLLKAYEVERKPDADAIADLAMRNFVEMRDLTGDPEFLLRKKIEVRFSEKYPEKWSPLYSLVTFSPEVRYSDAIALGKRQDELMAEIMSMPNIHENWDSPEVEERMLALAEKL